MTFRRLLVVLAVAMAAVVAWAPAAYSGQPHTILVSNETPKEGETITVTSGDNNDSTCEGGYASVYLVHEDHTLTWKYAEPDEFGHWSVQLTIPYADDHEDWDLSEPLVIEAHCADLGAEAGPQATPPFPYEPVEIWVQPGDRPEPPAPAPTPAVIEPKFTG